VAVEGLAALLNIFFWFFVVISFPSRIGKHFDPADELMTFASVT
jgi:hypothetical protein